jgi:HEAT repeat protein
MRQQRYRSETELLSRAIDGDALAVESVISYLSSENPDLRHILQNVLHDCSRPELWRCLLRLAAVRKWGLGVTSRLDILTKIPTDAHTLARLDQSIAEAFALDETDIERDEKDAVLHLGLADSDTRMRWTAAYLLGLRGHSECIPILDEMIIQGAVEQGLKAIEALAILRDEACGPCLIHAIERRGTALHHSGWRTMNELGRIVAPAMIAALEHKDSHIRWHAARALGQIGDPRAIQTLANGLCDENESVRWASARALAELDALAVPAILEQLVKCQLDETLRQAVLHALKSMPSQATQEFTRPLIEVLNSPTAYIRAPIEAQKLLKEWRLPERK